MARRKRAMDSREVGLVMGLAAGKYLFDADDLHYGLWPAELEVSHANLKQAQNLHSELIISSIPADVKTILDVGCGAGALAKRLLAKGFQVEGVSPSGPLTEKARETVGPGCTIHATKFEDFASDRKFDLILFSESYQYINLRRSFEQARALLRPNGYMMICDFFRRPHMDRGPIRGGHRWELFEEILGQHPFTPLLDRDITEETSRNYDLVNDLLQKVGVPGWELGFRYLNANYPRLTRVGKWLFRKRIAKLERKYFSGQRTAQTFMTYKTYRLLLYQLHS